MASACAASLSMLDAGIPLTAPVAGVSVGLTNSQMLLLDITGTEDHFGMSRLHSSKPFFCACTLMRVFTLLRQHGLQSMRYIRRHHCDPMRRQNSRRRENYYRCS